MMKVCSYLDSDGVGNELHGFDLSLFGTEFGLGAGTVRSDMWENA
jgi:hypothetical protein